MLINKDTIDKVFETADIVEVISEFVTLKKKGANHFGLSPFVDEKSPSFSVSEVKGIWKCFSSGKSGSNAVSFLMEAQHMSYPEAVKHIANKYSIPVVAENAAQAKVYEEKQQKKKDLLPLMDACIKKFEDAFWKLPANHPAKIEVFQKRQYTEELAKELRIGYAPGHRYIYDVCVENGRKQDAKDLFLITDEKDKWVNRVIYPFVEVFAGKPKPVSLAGRSLSKDKKYAKWINSMNTELYQKDKFWYGMHLAKHSIAKSRTAWVVEGYNDVIAWQRFGIPNTVSPCGTAITTNQIKMLRKFADYVVFCLDPDKAGTKAMIKQIQQFLKADFRCYVVELPYVQQPYCNLKKVEQKDLAPLNINKKTISLPKKPDPDDYVRLIQAVDENSLDHINNKKSWKDGFRFLLENKKSHDEVENRQMANEMLSLISSIKDDGMQDIYLKWLAKESGTTQAKINSLFKELEKQQEVTPQERIKDKLDNYNLYEMPEDVKEPLEKYIKLIQKYRLFQANNKIYVQYGENPPYGFKAVSNFSIEIIQHMEDEDRSKKLVRIKNTHNKESVFDVDSALMNKPSTFEDVITLYGNYQWKGDRKEHQLLKFYLFDFMGTGRQIDVLGWQPEGFWVWNNLIVTEHGEKLEIDKNGCFSHKEVAYYIPSANRIYINNPYKYLPQKSFLSIKTEANFFEVCKMANLVHGNHGIMGILFAVSSIFQDIVVKHLSSFPLLFLYGPASSGKDQLASMIKSFVGIPQVSINLEGNASTQKGKIRELAQFCNGISQYSEYKPGNPELDGMLKGVWDRDGYKTASITSRISMNSVPVLSSAIVTGNYVPDQEALITRLIWNLMDKGVFSEEDEKNFQILSDYVQKGFSSLTNDLLKHRKLVEGNFVFVYRNMKKLLKELKPNANPRMIQNLSVLGSFYKLLSDHVDFSFNLTSIITIFEKIIDSQMNKLSSASLVNKFWDCFLASMRGSYSDRLELGRDYALDGTTLYYSWTNVYNKVSRQWYLQYKEAVPSKTVLADQLKKDAGWVDYIACHYYSSNKRSSAFCSNIKDLAVCDDLMLAVEYERDRVEPFEKKDKDEQQTETPATPDTSYTDSMEGEQQGFEYPE